MAEPVKICIVMDGGLIQSVLSAGIPIEYVKIDYDTDGADEEELAEVPQDNGTTVPAFVSLGEAEITPEDQAFTMRAFAIVEAKE